MTTEFNFDRPMQRAGMGSQKFDGRSDVFGRADVIPLWVADMDFAAPPSALAALRERIVHPFFGYQVPDEALLAAFCGWHQRRHQWNIDPAHIMWSPGTMPIVVAAVLALTEPGDQVIVPAPVYPPFFGSVTRNKRTLVTHPLRTAGGAYGFDFEALERQAAKGAKMLLLCSPHNPVGRVWGVEELDQLIDLALRYQMVIVSDDVHADLVYPGAHYTPLGIRAPDELRLVTALSQAKPFNMPGMGLSAAVVSNRQDYSAMRRIFKRLHLSAYNPLTMAAYEAAYRDGDAWLDALLVYLDGNRRWLFDALSELPGLEPVMPESTYLMWVDNGGLGKTDAELKRFFVEEAGLGLTTGASFGPGGSGYMRWNFGTQRSVLEHAVSQLRGALERVARGR